MRLLTVVMGADGAEASGLGMRLGGSGAGPADCTVTGELSKLAT